MKNKFIAIVIYILIALLIPRIVYYFPEGEMYMHDFIIVNVGFALRVFFLESAAFYVFCKEYKKNVWKMI